MGRVTFRSAITASETFAALFLLSFAKKNERRTNKEEQTREIISFLRYGERRNRVQVSKLARERESRLPLESIN